MKQDALDRLTETEKAKKVMEEKLEEKKKEQPKVGKIVTPDAFTHPDSRPIVSHRGLGAFTEGSFDAELLARSKSVDEQLQSPGLEDKEHDFNEKECINEEDDNDCDEGIEKGDESVDESNEVVVTR